MGNFILISYPKSKQIIKPECPYWYLILVLDWNLYNRGYNFKIQTFMQSSKYKIFGHGRGGIDISQIPQNPQGRNVQPFTSNKKIQQQFEKQIQSPFDGYSSVVSAQNNLAQSQVSDLNLELTRRLIKEQLNRFGDVDQSKWKNDINIMKTEMRSLKEFVSQNLTKRDDEEFKKDILKDFDRLLEEYHDQTARNLREVIKKFDQNIKTDCAKKYLPLDFINDVEKQFVELEDRIGLIETKIDGKKQRPSEDPVVIAQAFELRLKKHERQIESVRKTVIQIQGLVNNLSQANVSLKSKQSEDEERIIQKIQELKKHDVEYQKQIKNLSTNLEELKNENLQLTKKIQALQENESKYMTKQLYKQGSGESSEVKQFLNSSKGLAVSGVYENQSQNYRQLFKSPIKDTLSHKDSTNSVELGKPSKEKKIEDSLTLCYRIDKDNFLLDEEGNYILSQQGKEIQLTQEQILILRKSTLVKLCE